MRTEAEAEESRSVAGESGVTRRRAWARSVICVLALAFSTVSVARAQADDPPYKIIDIHVDHLGSTRMTTDEGTFIESQHDFFPFGEEITPMVDETTKMFTGHERDGETGLDYMLARYYGSGIGRFLSPDPVVKKRPNSRSPQRWNRFCYALNNPLTLRDPDGLDVVYVDQYARDLVDSTRAVSPATEATIARFESDPTRTLTLQTGDVPDESTFIISLGLTETHGPSDRSENPNEFTVTFDAEDIGDSDGRGTAIHEIVGHVKTNSERSYDETASLSPEKREEDAEDATVTEIESIPEEIRPDVPPPPHKQSSGKSDNEESDQ